MFVRWIAILLLAGSTHAVEMEWVTVGDAGNPPDKRFAEPGYGNVDYLFQIGKYEVTNAQYAEFLNAVAADDPNALYNEEMAGGWHDIGGITRTGSSGNYAYSVRPNRGRRPVNYVGWFDALRFANWMHNGQPTGPQDATTTENGAYDLSQEDGVVRKFRARVFLPTENEWYKAAYYDKGQYWSYPTQSHEKPTPEFPPGADMTNGSANYYSGRWVDPLYYTTEVGAYGGKPSRGPYGTFDQGGNVWEWNETLLIGGFRGVRGGSFHSANYLGLHAVYAYYFGPPRVSYYYLGFRVARARERSGGFDSDADGDIDLSDFAAFQRAFGLGTPGHRTPTLPDTPFDYVAYTSSKLPEHYAALGAIDNTPPDNPITNEGATLGRVLFHDERLSVNHAVSCSSCHQQSRGFSDSRRFSVGFQGKKTRRNAMSLTNAKYYGSPATDTRPGEPRPFAYWDERAESLEAQHLQVIQSPHEMGMTLPALEVKLAGTSFYPGLFEAAFGDDRITGERISKALAQFVRSMVSYQSKYDRALVLGSTDQPDLDAAGFSNQEKLGYHLFTQHPANPVKTMACDDCHKTAAQVAEEPTNTGLDLVPLDQGAALGAFKVPSLRNVALTAPYMHDGRFATLQDVIRFYATGVQNDANLSRFLRENNDPDGPAERRELSDEEIEALVAFLYTLTDDTFSTAAQFSDPFQN
ncbi:MAG: SUMF1/EgtB/PvdO family nonheme iron enzyme [Planctomycetes bacterium]|nr:SUMF1/EgtB/PvdO family nonheme iron enzyme [Planctomycetota bacterium]